MDKLIIIIIIIIIIISIWRASVFRLRRGPPEKNSYEKMEYAVMDSR
jgi:uncharacterized protein YpmB